MSFAEIDDAAWPVVVVRYRHTSPSEEEQRAYFARLAGILNDRVAPGAPAHIVFDASGASLASGVSLQFFGVHNDFNRAYQARFGMCSGFGIVAGAVFGGLIKTALDLVPSKRPCAYHPTVEAAVKAATAGA